MSRRRRLMRRLRRWAPFAGFYLAGYHLGRGEGKRSMSKVIDEYGRSLGHSGYPIAADVVRVHLEGGGLRRFWPRQKVEVRDAG
jgi:hypothetical protein